MLKNKLKLRNVVAIVICLAVTTFFSGCDSYSDEMPISSVKLVSRVDCNDGYYDYTTKYEYDAQNRIIKILTTNDYGGIDTLIITYPSANRIVMYQKNNIDTLTMNSDGSVASFNSSILTYNNGHLQTIEWSLETVDLGIIETYIETRIWENENIKTLTIDRKYNTQSWHNSSHTENFEYGSTLNKPISIDFGFSEGSGGLPRGWFGKSTINLPSKKIIKYDTDVYTTTYRYEIDAEGYVTKMYDEVNKRILSIQYK